MTGLVKFGVLDQVLSYSFTCYITVHTSTSQF